MSNATNQSVTITNCFTLGYYGSPKMGIQLQHSWDGFAEQHHVDVGGYEIRRDNDFGYDVVVENGNYMVYSASTREITPKNGRKFSTMQKPVSGTNTCCLVLIDCRVPHLKKVSVNGHILRMHTGTLGGKTVGKGDTHILLEVIPNESFFIFYEDGVVRKCTLKDNLLMETQLTHEDMLDARIDAAKAEIARADQISDPAKRERFVISILCMSINLLDLTSLYDHDRGRAMRFTILRELFSNLTEEQLNAVHRRVSAVLHQTRDTFALDFFNEGKRPREDKPRKAPQNEAPQTPILTPEEREAQRLENIRKSKEAHAQKQAKQAIFRAKRSAEAANKAANNKAASKGKPDGKKKKSAKQTTKA